ncbi:MAG: cobalt transporter CbiM [Thermodesulfobacteriota bacterium]
MHISEGIVSAPVLIGGAALTVIGTAIGLKKLDYDRIMVTAMLVSTFFVASLIHVPLGPGSVHLILNGLLGVLLGWACFPAILTALLLQAVFFQYGGIIVLGVNCVIMAVPALASHLLFHSRLFAKTRLAVKGFVAGGLAVMLSSLLMATALALSDSGFIATAKIVVAAHLPVMIIEGLITMFVLSFINRVQPKILQALPEKSEK